MMRLVIVGVLLSGAVAAAQNPTLQRHPDDYTRADIEYGSRVSRSGVNQPFVPTPGAPSP
jgi:hypothetical protein